MFPTFRSDAHPNNNDKFSKNKWSQASGVYETVGPALPQRPQSFESNLKNSGTVHQSSFRLKYTKLYTV